MDSRVASEISNHGRRATLHSLCLARVVLIGSEAFTHYLAVIQAVPNIGIGLSLNKMTWLDV
jgi:hypothetical protein